MDKDTICIEVIPTMDDSIRAIMFIEKALQQVDRRKEQINILKFILRKVKNEKKEYEP